MSRANAFNPFGYLIECADYIKDPSKPIKTPECEFFAESLRMMEVVRNVGRDDTRFNEEIKPCLVSCRDVDHYYFSNLISRGTFLNIQTKYDWALISHQKMERKQQLKETFIRVVRKIFKTKAKEVVVEGDPFSFFMARGITLTKLFNLPVKAIKKLISKSFDSDDDDVSDNEIVNPKSISQSLEKTSKSTKHINTIFVYCVKKLIIERKRTNPSLDPWDSFFYISMSPDKYNPTFRMTLSAEKALSANRPLSKDLITINPFEQATIDKGPLQRKSIEPNMLPSEVNIMDAKRIKQQQYGKSQSPLAKIDRKVVLDGFSVKNDAISLPVLVSENKGNQFNMTTIQENKALFLPPITGGMTRDVATGMSDFNSFPKIGKKKPQRQSINETVFQNHLSIPALPRARSNSNPGWRFTNIVRHSPNGRTTSNRSFYLPYLARSTAFSTLNALTSNTKPSPTSNTYQISPRKLSPI
uniref:RUN domain-containing protein n=1 Tax=Rhabditophanes sp. KR3021 TaxID=114890 RepID=A0AC35U1V9_9BILA